MKRKGFLKAIWIVGVFCLLFAGRSYSQVFSSLWSSSHTVGTITGNYNFSYSQTPDQLVELSPASIRMPGGVGYQWQQSDVPLESGFTDITTGGTSTSYTFPTGYHLPHTMYFRRKAYSITTPGNVNYSNILKLSLVSVNWEDIDYIREHTVMTTGITDWQSVDQLPIGQKMQATNYLDGLGRSTERITRETATPATVGGTWGDLVQFTQYDALGRESVKYLSYTTSTESGKYKSAPLTDQPAYYSSVYGETSAFNSISFDNSPLNRPVLIKESGQKWAASAGSSAFYDVNTSTDNVQIWAVDYIQGNGPINMGAYPAGTLYKYVYTDVNNKQSIEYMDKEGRLILKKTQIDDAPSAAHTGWSCVYSVYDHFGQLRFQIQPEGVKYLDANSWSFAGTNGQTVLAEQVFQYNYDDRGMTVWKKAPGSAPLTMLYDLRDRMVFTQDGNQAALSTPQWTASLYDDLDRTTTTLLYNTTSSAATLQSDINNAVSVTTVNVPSYTAPGADLSYNVRSTSISRYVATHSITFNPGFQTPAGDQFVAEIDPTPSTQGYSGTVTTLNNPISTANLANSAVCTIVKYLFYDNYAFNGVKSFDNSFTNGTAYSTSDPNVQPIVPTVRTTSFATGTLTRVLGTNTFLTATLYYDDKGNAIQSLEDNIKGGTDILTSQYHFDERILSTCQSHTAPGTGYSAYITLTKYLFDKLGRVTSIQKQYGSNPLKTVSSYDYDDMGRVKSKHLDPGYSNPGSGQPELESLNYTFNIHDQITGINQDYALKKAGSYNKWGHFFGLYIGYDNKDNVFNASQLNGQVTGVLWNTQGDDAQRKYDYTYDNGGRLIKAAFMEQQHPGDGWSNTRTDFSVGGGVTGQITYDLNGNLLTMLQKGVVPGTSTPVVIDDLRYEYNAYSNKLKSVTDQMVTPSVNGQFGDFKDGANTAGTADYVYDNNGNVVIDLNKNVQNYNGTTGTNGIHYNYLDKPDQIRIVGKGTIKIVYSADGEKLQRAFIPETGGSSTITSYLQDFVYQETAALTLSSPAPFSGTGVKLAYINFEDGRIRVMTSNSTGNGLDGITENGNISLPNGQSGAWDYFILDYQKNVRMILTEETHSAFNTCTMETTNGRPAAEDPVFGQTGAGNEVETTRVPTPSGWQSINSTASVSSLGNLSGHIIGPNTLQKVMAGDQVTASSQYYYQGAVTNSNPNIIPNVLNSLAGALGGSVTNGTIVHGNAANITSQLNANPAFVTAVEPTGSGGTTPQAYLTILFFDERFNLIPAADGGMYQEQVASSWTTTTPPLTGSLKAPKNGYVYIYLSNRSDQPVYFDNFVVSIAAGNIIEENHYYAFGLKIAGISSKKLGDANEGKLKNPYQFNDKEMLDEDADLNWYDYGFRCYDPQIGRFMQLDPLTWDYEDLTPYQFAGNDPIANVDVDGLEPANVTSFVKSLGQGIETTTRFITTGTAAGKWAVSWVQNGVAYAKIFSAAAPVASTAATVGKVAVQAAKVVANFVPVLSGAMDIHEGIKEGSWWKVGLGVLSIVADVATLGGSSLIKGAAKTVIKEGVEVLAKDAVETGVKSIVKQGEKALVKDAAEQGAKQSVETIVKQETKQASLKSLRKKAVRDAWKEEKKLVEETGAGTREWTEAETKELLTKGKVKGYQGHHINNVKHHPHLAGESDNIKFLTRKEHLDVHGGNFKNKTTGDLVNRKI